uniref:Death domain-containing protein n=2 Tax=Clastoptera arizonana TaxID=38151 RepID=A0A1B6CXE8_9HEMI
MCPKANSFEIWRQELLEAVKIGLNRKNVEIIQKKFNSLSTVSNLEKRSVLDQSFRDLLLTLLTDNVQDILTWESYLTLCIESCRREIVTTTMPVILLGEIFDASTLDKCEELFTFVESNVFIWKEDMFFGACKNNLLRMCNDLLRRLSRSQNTVFCGRILLFLAKFFPFSERSGLNIVSEFNLENITEFSGDEALDFSQIEDKDEGIDDGKTEKLKIDYNLYTKFWALQDFFRNPNQCYNKMQWKIFCNHTTHVLAAFKSFKLDEIQANKASVVEDQKSKSHCFAKFLTNQKLLELQLSDVNFRRYILVQFLILFQYLNSPVKFKSDNFELKADQLDLIKDTKQQVFALIKETPPDGVMFLNCVQHILQREEHWNNWKNDGCPEFQKPAPPLEESSEEEKKQRPNRQKKRLGDLFREADTKQNIIVGKTELNKLWNRNPNNLDACRSTDRDFLPSLETYFEQAIEQSDPAAMVEDQYKQVNNGNFGWRALRLLARKSPHFFTQSNANISKLPEYLDSMIKKIPKERPGPSVSSNQDVRNEIDTGLGVNDEEDELMKNDERHIENSDNLVDQNKDIVLTEEQLESISCMILDDWKILAEKLNYLADEIEFFAKAKSSVSERAKLMIQTYCKDSDDIDQLINLLGELGYKEAIDILKP